MSSANWNHETKSRLNEKMTNSLNDLGSLVRHVIRLSKSNELLAQAAKNFAFQETAVHNSHESLKKMGLIVSHMQFQGEAIERSMETLDNIHDILRTIQR